MTVSASVLTDLPEQPYEAIRKLVRTGDLALCSGENPFSHVIRWATDSPWSHIAMVVRLDELDRVMVVEAVAKTGVRVVPLSRFVSEGSNHRKPFPGRIVMARHADFDERVQRLGLRTLDEFAFDRLGAPFSNAEITRIGVRIALGWLGVKVPRAVQPKDEYFCSEFVAECYHQIGIDIPWDGRGFIAPDDFAADPKIEAVARVARHPQALA